MPSVRRSAAAPKRAAGAAADPPRANRIEQALARLGLARPEDRVLHLPLRYEDETVVTPLAAAPIGEPVQLKVRIVDVAVQFRPRRQLVVRGQDDSGEVWLRYLNFYGSQTTQFERARDAGDAVLVFGEARHGFLGLELVHPRVRVVTPGAALPAGLTPVYPTTAGLSQAALRKAIAAAQEAVDLSDPWPAAAHRLPGWPPGLPPLADAVTFLHAPPPGLAPAALLAADLPQRRRLKFDELLAQQLSLRRAYRARRTRRAPALAAGGPLTAGLLARLPFALTPAQQRVRAEIDADLGAPHPMQRLLQGDVGSGKTVVAALAACRAIDAGYQAAFMAPTEILAEQHYRKLVDWLAPLGVSVVWLAGSLKAAEKRRGQALAAGDAQLIVGTHALIQGAVDFARLGLVVVDEQHRFGVAQRLALRQKGEQGGVQPHQLMMSATPIPRTLAMTYYADLDVSVIDEAPPGRSPVKTRLIADTRRDEVIARIRDACGGGRQAYWVCPLIEESEALELQTAIDTHARLAAELAPLAVGLVHGRLKGAEKAAVMGAFAAGEIDVLVATTVIEVGVDVPNASLMVIEHAERFGLAQLHQLRGRVGRGAVARYGESVCVLLYAQPLSETARARLKIIFESTDGFEIARQDLALRGPGEFIGHRQSGAALLRYADLEMDVDLVAAAQQLAGSLLDRFPEAAAAHVARWLGGREALLKA